MNKPAGGYRGTLDSIADSYGVLRYSKLVEMFDLSQEMLRHVLTDHHLASGLKPSENLRPLKTDCKKTVKLKYDFLWRDAYKAWTNINGNKDNIADMDIMYSARMLALSAYTIRHSIYGQIKELKNAPPPDTFDMFPVTMSDLIAYLEENRTETNSFVLTSTNPSATEYVLGAAERVIMGIETKLNYIKTFHNHLTNSTRKTTSFVRSEMKEINKYAKFGTNISKLLMSFEEYPKSNLLLGAFKLFEKDLTSELLELSFIAKEETLHHAHAAIHDLEYGENYGFLDGNGETTSLYFRLIKAVQEGICQLDFINTSSGDSELFKYRGTMTQLFNLNQVRAEIKENWHATVASHVNEAILAKQGLAKALHQSKGVFEYFHHILNSFGVPYNAQNISHTAGEHG